MRESTRSAAAKALWSSEIMLATSLIGPENFREYWTKLERSPRPTLPFRNSREPNTHTRVRETLLMKFTEGPVMVP